MIVNPVAFYRPVADDVVMRQFVCELTPPTAQGSENRVAYDGTWSAGLKTPCNTGHRVHKSNT